MNRDYSVEDIVQNGVRDIQSYCDRGKKIIEGITKNGVKN
jgi:hypothetical protein